MISFCFLLQLVDGLTSKKSFFIGKYDLRCDLFPIDGCMELKAKDDSGELELKLKGEPKLADLLKYSSETLPLLKKEIGVL